MQPQHAQNTQYSVLAPVGTTRGLETFRLRTLSSNFQQLTSSKHALPSTVSTAKMELVCRYLPRYSRVPLAGCVPRFWLRSDVIMTGPLTIRTSTIRSSVALIYTKLREYLALL